MTRRLSARTIVQYETLEVDRTRTSLLPRRSVNVDLLFTYMVHPGTAVYIAWNSDRRPDVASKANQLFVKVSYLFRP
jgi:hypothetical protein